MCWACRDLARYSTRKAVVEIAASRDGNGEMNCAATKFSSATRTTHYFIHDYAHA